MAAEHVPTQATRLQVEALAQYVPQFVIAAHIGIDEKTLRRHYRDELDRGAAAVNIKLGQRQIECALFGGTFKKDAAGNPERDKAGNLIPASGFTSKEAASMLMFLGKVRLRQSETIGLKLAQRALDEEADENKPAQDNTFVFVFEPAGELRPLISNIKTIEGESTRIEATGEAEADAPNRNP